MSGTGVHIPIQADASPTLQAIESIRRALRAAGQDGQSLASIDLSNLGSADLVRDLERAAQNLKDLTNMGRGKTAADARRVLGGNPDLDSLFNIEESANRAFPDQGDKRRFVNNVTNYALRGTSFDPATRPPEPLPADAPPPPPGPPPAPRPEPPGGDSGAAVLGMLKGGLLGGLGFAAAQIGISSVAGAANMAIGAGERENNATDSLLRHTGDLTTTFEKLRETMDYYHLGMQASRADFEQYADIFAQASGNITAKAAAHGAILAAGLGAGYHEDPATFARSLGQANMLGIAPEKFAELVGESAVRGSMGGRVEEVMGALLHWTQSASRFSGTVGGLNGSLDGFADMYASMNASGSPALRGQNAESVIGQLNSSITAGGGGGQAGQILTMRAMMAAGIKDPYAIQMRLAGGAFGRGSDGKGATNYELISAELKREYGALGADRAALAAGTLFGLNPLVAQQLGRMNLQHIDLGALNKTLEPYGGLGGGVNPAALGDIITAQTAGPDALKKMAHTLLSTPGMSVDNVTGLHLGLKGNTESLRSAVIKASAETGLVQNDYTRATEATNKLTDKFTDIGHGLIEVMTPLKDTTAAMLAPLAQIALELGAKVVPGPTVLPTGYIGPHVGAGVVDGGGGLMQNIAQQESSGGATSPRIYGEVPSTFLEDIKGAAQSYPDIARMIAGKTDAQIMALQTSDNPNLQKRTSAWRMKNVLMPFMASKGMPMSDLSADAAWTFFHHAPDIMKSGNDGALLSAFLTPAEMAQNPGWQGMTVGQWKASRKQHGFSDIPFAGAGSGGGGGTFTVNPGSPITVVVKTDKGETHSKHDVGWHAASESTPRGVTNNPAPIPSLGRTEY